MVVKLNAKKLKEFINKCTLGGTIKSCVIKGDGEGIKIRVKEGIAVGVVGLLKLPQQEQFKLGIRSNKVLMGMLSNFNGDVFIAIQNNQMKLYDEKKEYNFNLASEDYIENNMTQDLNLEYPGEFDLDTTLLTTAIKNRNLIEAESLVLEVKDKNFLVTVVNTNNDMMTEKVAVDYINCRGEFGDPLVSVINALGDRAKVSLKDNYPVMFVENTEEFFIKSFVAPKSPTAK